MLKTSQLLLVLSILFGCGDQKDKKRPASPRIRKETKIISPNQNQTFTLGDSIPLEVKSEVTIDSVHIEMDDIFKSFENTNFTITSSSPKVGPKRIKVTVFFSGKSEKHYSKVIFLPKEAPEDYTYKIINIYPHDKNDYTQGLLINNGFIYESNGQYGKSTLEKKNIETGQTLQQINLTNEFFGEGLALINNQFYQLTYTSGACFVYDQNFEKVNTFHYQGEGWGLCEFNGTLLMTNGGEKLLVREPSTFSVIEEWHVYDHQGKVDNMNELEIIDGLIYANVYRKDYIIVIDPESNAVIRKIDMRGLLNDRESKDADVLNGIAYDQNNDRIFITGKLWPKLFEVKFVPKDEAL